jgi:prepilin-type N-terminal cleavage/methylation domain-containing protein
VLNHTPDPPNAFTLIELMVVIAVILILAGLVLSISGYATDKGKRSRAESEIAAMSAAMESYKADNGIYPRGNASGSFSTPYDTDSLDARQNTDPTQSVYQKASFYLYTQLSGLNASQQPVSGMKSYFTFKPQMLGHVPSTSPTVAYIRDPWGNSYGYSTAQAATPGGNQGYNPTFDLWSTTGPTPTPAPSPVQVRWIKNW